MNTLCNTMWSKCVIAPKVRSLPKLLTCQQVYPRPQATTQSQINSHLPKQPVTASLSAASTLANASFPQLDVVKCRRRETKCDKEKNENRMSWRRTPHIHPPPLHTLPLSLLSTPENRSGRSSPWGAETERPGQVLPWYSCSAEIPHNQLNRSPKALW